MTDRRERMGNLSIMLRGMLRNTRAEMWTSLPAVLVSYDVVKVTCEAQPTIQARLAKPDSTYSWVTLPKCVDCPVIFPGGGGFVASFPLAAGDEGLLIFASRCIDAWWQSGAKDPASGKPVAQIQADLRMHDLSDGFFLPLCFSQTNLPTNLSTTAARLTTKNGSAYVELTPNGEVNIVALNSTTSGNFAVGTGASGSFMTPLGQTVTVQNGIITNIF